jgi:hypothetical protein
LFPLAGGSAAERLLECILSDKEEHQPRAIPPPPPPPVPEELKTGAPQYTLVVAESSSFSITSLRDLFSEEDLLAGCRGNGVCYVTGAQEMRIPTLPSGDESNRFRRGR